jgi:hypothetical protein
MEGSIEFLENGHGGEQVGKKRRCRDSCDTRWGEASEERPDGEGARRQKRDLGRRDTTSPGGQQ